MAVEFINYITVIMATALVTYVFVRSSGSRPARYFFMTAGFLILLRVASLFRTTAYSETTATATLFLVSLALGGMCTGIMLFIGSLFFPEWWQGSRPIRWIVLPYIVVIAAIVLDQLFDLDLITTQLSIKGSSYFLPLVEGVDTILMALMTIGIVIFPVASLIAAFLLNPKSRKTIMLLIIILLMGFALAQVINVIPGFSEYSGQVQTILMLGSFGYIVLRERVFDPRRLGMRLAMEGLQDAVVVVDQAGKVLFANDTANTQGIHEEGMLRQQFEASAIPAATIDLLLAPLINQTPESLQITVETGAKTLEAITQPILDNQGKHQGLLLLLMDRTELTERTRQLNHDQTRLSELAQRLQQEQAQRSDLVATVRALSLPLIPILQGVLVLPLIGTFDEKRLQEFKQVLLEGIQSMRAKHVLLDMTGAELIDDQHIAGILQGIKAARLLGAECTLVGIRPEVAQSLVSQGFDLRDVASAATLREALAVYFIQ